MTVVAGASLFALLFVASFSALPAAYGDHGRTARAHRQEAAKIGRGLSGIVVGPRRLQRTRDVSQSAVKAKLAPSAPASLLDEGQKSRDVVVCRGIGDLNDQAFKELGQVWSRYAKDGVITATSPLLYKITDNGSFAPFGSEHQLEELTQQHLNPTGKVLPHVWCDASCCDNCHLPGAIQEAMDRREEFFQESVDAAQKYGWSGFVLDFEGSMPGRDSTTPFFKEWRSFLAKSQAPSGRALELHLWTGSGADTGSLVQTSNSGSGDDVMDSMIDMSMYYESEAEMPRPKRPRLVSHLEISASKEASLLNTSASPAASTGNGTGSATGMCPYGFGPHRHMQTSFLQNNESDSTSPTSGHQVLGASRRELTSHIDGWCSETGASCGVGLITYDLSNTRLGCDDMVAVGAASLRHGVRSLWIWSGGIVPRPWEAGLRSYVSGKEEVSQTAACQEDSTAVLTQVAAGCAFDRDYACDGQRK